MCASIACSAVWFVHTCEFKFHLSIDGANQEVITFMVVWLQKTGPDVLVALVLFCQMVGHPPCKNFVEPKDVMQFRMGCTLAEA